jgi:hypothetical protein
VKARCKRGIAVITSRCRLSGRGKTVAIVALGMLLAVPACSPGRRTAGEAIFPFVDAIQSGDLQRLRCLYAGSVDPNRAFAQWARSRYAAFEEARANGTVDVTGDPIALVKAFGLGKGTLIGVSTVRTSGPEILEADTPATFHYEEISTSGLPAGSSFSVCVLPVGRMATVIVPEQGGRQSLEVLKGLTLRWRVRRTQAAPDCPNAWAVESVAPVPGTETTTRATWVF